MNKRQGFNYMEIFFGLCICYWIFYFIIPSLYRDAKYDIKELPIMLEINNKELEKLKSSGYSKDILKRIKYLEKKNKRIQGELEWSKNFLRKFEYPEEQKEGDKK